MEDETGGGSFEDDDQIDEDYGDRGDISEDDAGEVIPRVVHVCRARAAPLASRSPRARDHLAPRGGARGCCVGALCRPAAPDSQALGPPGLHHSQSDEEEHDGGGFGGRQDEEEVPSGDEVSGAGGGSGDEEGAGEDEEEEEDEEDEEDEDEDEEEEEEDVDAEDMARAERAAAAGGSAGHAHNIGALDALLEAATGVVPVRASPHGGSAWAHGENGAGGQGAGEISQAEKVLMAAKEKPKKKDNKAWPAASRPVARHEHEVMSTDTRAWVHKMQKMHGYSDQQFARWSGVPIERFLGYMQGDVDPRVTNQLRRYIKVLIDKEAKRKEAELAALAARADGAVPGEAGTSLPPPVKYKLKVDKVDAVSIKNKAQSFNPHMFDTLDQATPQGRLVRPHPARYTAHPPPQFFRPACTPS